VIECRPVRPGDIPALADLAQRSWLDAFGSSVSAEDATEEAASRSEAYFASVLEKSSILVAELDGVLAGYVQFDDEELQRLYVETELQGRGIGRALLDAALEHPRLARAPRVHLQVWEENERAVRLYESAGFRRAGTTSFAIGSGEVVEDLVMVLERT
jgi:ribosomal protein S18 acetylase RimI-like enzyme